MTGRQRDLGGSDYEDGLVCFSHKHSYNQPGYMLGWLRAITTFALGRKKIGCIVWHKKGGRMNDSLVVIRFADWVQLHGDPRRGEADEQDL